MQCFIQVGGDNASRAVVLGMVMGAAQGVESIPSAWRDSLVNWKKCDKLLSKLPLLSGQHQEL